MDKTQGKPFQARYEHISKTKLADDRIEVERQAGMIYRDSHGRERRDDYDDNEHFINVYDPISKTEFMLLATAKAVLYKTSLPEDGFRALTFSVGKSAIAFSLSSPLSSTDNDPELDWKEIEGMRRAGHRIHRPGEYTAQFWFSEDLDQLVLINIKTDTSDTTWRLFDFSFIEPEPGCFDIPEDFTEMKQSSAES